MAQARQEMDQKFDPSPVNRRDVLAHAVDQLVVRKPRMSPVDVIVAQRRALHAKKAALEAAKNAPAPEPEKVVETEPVAFDSEG